MPSVSIGVSLSSFLGGSGFFNPGFLAPYEWLDASDNGPGGSIADTAGAVDTFRDLYSNGVVYSGSGAARPTTGVDTLNGRNLITSDGADILTTPFSVLPHDHTGSFSLVFAGIIQNDSGYLKAYDADNASQGTGLFFDANDSRVYLTNGNVSGGFAYVDVPVGTPIILICNYVAGAVTWWLNGEQAGVSQGTYTFAAPNSSAALFGRATSSAAVTRGTGSWAEGGATPLLTEQQRTDLTEYLASPERWNLSGISLASQTLSMPYDTEAGEQFGQIVLQYGPVLPKPQTSLTIPTTYAPNDSIGSVYL